MESIKKPLYLVKILSFIIIIGAFSYYISYLFASDDLFLLSSIVLIVFTIINSLLLFKRFRDITNPLFLFSIFWNLGVSVSALKLSKLQTKWEVLTWICFYVAYIGFVIIYALLSQKEETITDCKPFSITQEYKTGLKKVIVMLTIISVVSILIEWILIGFLPILSSKPHAYSYFHISGLHYFSLLFVFVPSLAIIDLYDNNLSIIKSLTKDKVILACIIISFVLPVILVSRYELIFLVLFALMTYLIISKSRNLKLIIMSVVIISIGWIIMTYFRHHSISYLNEIFEMKNPNIPIFITQPYIYIANNFDNFNQLVKHLPEFTFGKRMIFPIYALSGMKFLYPAFYPGTIYVTKEELTTVTLFYDAYYDFGLIGVGVFSCISGGISKLIHAISNKKQNPAFILLLAQLNIYLVLSFFTTWFSNPTTWFNIVITLLIYLYLEYNKKRGKRNEV